MNHLSIRVDGVPVPQGSMRAFARGGRAHVVASNRDRLAPWRADIVEAARRATTDRGITIPFTGGQHVALSFWLPRAKSHHTACDPGRGLKKSAPADHTQTPDVDKLARAVLDALTTAGVWGDDSQVSCLSAVKFWCEPGFAPCALITVRPVGEVLG